MSASSPGDETRPRRLTARDMDELETAVLGDLKANGPSVISAIRVRLYSMMGEHLVKRTLEALADQGRVVVEVKVLTFDRMIDGVERQIPYKAREYAASKLPLPAQERTVASPSPQSAGAQREKQARREAQLELVLADIAKNGPSFARDLESRLKGRIGEIDLRSTLAELTKTGLLVVELLEIVKPIAHGERRWPVRYKANRYSLPRGPRARKPKRG
ncbi:hypothetical protein [Singulisphaera sp. PoT]|uniref:hypothetical protein n=1 Tax=Singulisphaera sp. PoT TaxID=3411797 RepID=UPI003BF46CCF